MLRMLEQRPFLGWMERRILQLRVLQQLPRQRLLQTVFLVIT